MDSQPHPQSNHDAGNTAGLTTYTDSAKSQGCTRYATGHGIFYIRATHSWNEPHHPATVEKVEGNFLTITSQGVQQRFWNHNPDHLQRMFEVANSGPDVKILWSSAYRILRVSRGTSGLMAGLSEHPEPPCYQEHPQTSAR